MASAKKTNPLMHELAALLITDAVQAIRFRFGDIQILPEDFRHIAFWLRKDSPFISVNVDKAGLDGLAASASYGAGSNSFTFSNDQALRSAAGRGSAVHESVHAITDSKKRTTLKLSEEATAFIARAWYHIETGTEDAYPHPAELLEIARKTRAEARSSSGVPAIGLGDRVKARDIMRGGYKPGLNTNKDGFP